MNFNHNVDINIRTLQQFIEFKPQLKYNINTWYSIYANCTLYSKSSTWIKTVYLVITTTLHITWHHHYISYHMASPLHFISHGITTTFHITWHHHYISYHMASPLHFISHGITTTFYSELLLSNYSKNLCSKQEICCDLIFSFIKALTDRNSTINMMKLSNKLPEMKQNKK